MKIAESRMARRDSAARLPYNSPQAASGTAICASKNAAVRNETQDEFDRDGGKRRGRQTSPARASTGASPRETRRNALVVGTVRAMRTRAAIGGCRESDTTLFYAASPQVCSTNTLRFVQKRSRLALGG
jgi:hypothetical protein